MIPKKYFFILSYQSRQLKYLIAVFISFFIFLLASFPNLLNEFSNLNFFNNSFLNEETFSTINLPRFQLLLLISPILSITLGEILHNLFCKKNLVNNLSIFKISRSKGYKFADIWYFIFSHLTLKFRFLLGITSFGYSYFSDAAKDFIHINLQKYSFFEHQSFIVAIFAILALDFSGYLSHRIQHGFPLMWSLHEFHHSATQMTIFSNSRRTVLEDLYSILLIPIPVLSGFLLAQLLQSSSYSAFVFLLFYYAYSSFSGDVAHSSFRVVYPKWLSFFLMSPSLHWIHHSSNPKHFNKNFGTFFTFWDKAFGTYLGEEHLSDVKEFGIKGSYYNKVHPFTSYFIIPIKRVLKKTKKYFYKNNTKNFI